MSTPIELNDIPADTSDNEVLTNERPVFMSRDTVLTNDVVDDVASDNIDHELDNNYDEDNVSYVNHSLSQQPLLNMSSFSNSMV